MTAPNRRQIMAGSLAALGAAGAPVTPAMAAQEADPTFAAIEAHKAACVRFDRAVASYGRAEYEASEAAIIAADDARDVAADALDALAMDFLKSSPTTAAGAVAFLAYIAELDDWAWPEGIELDVYRMLAGAIDRIAGGAS